MKYMQTRYYDPNTAPFTQEAPIGLSGGLNLYGYANGDPVNFSDPFGLCPARTLAEVPKCVGQLVRPHNMMRFETLTAVPSSSRVIRFA